MTNNEQDLEDALLIIKRYIDVAILNNAQSPTANKSTFVELRLINRVSLARICVLLNKPVNYINDLEAGIERLLIDDAIKLAAFYGVSADSLI
jgi:hypothetical protein